MAKLDYSEIREGKVIMYKGEPFTVVDSHVARTQQRKPQNQTKLKSLISGKTVAIAFHASDSAEEAELEKREMKFLYKTPKGEYWFSEIDNPSKRFTLSEDLLGDKVKYLKDNVVVKALLLADDEDGKVIGLDLPVKMDFKIVDCPPNVRGDTVSGGNKSATIETGAKVLVPLFVENGETIRVNTDTGEYVERVRN